MAEQRTQNGDSATARLEERYQSLASTVHAIEVRVNAGFEALNEKLDRRAEREKTPWGTLGTWAGVLIAVVIAVAGLLHYVISQQIEATRAIAAADARSSTAILNEHAERISSLRSEMTAQRSAGQRVETQLAGLSAVMNMADEHNRTLIALHHQKLFDGPLPPRLVWPTVGRDVGAHER